ncbi:MAG: hypothetical protein ACI9MF_002414, partial [Gammaproteobacteria bacterium]
MNCLIVESSANRASQANTFVGLVIQDPTLIELLNKDISELSRVESDRLTLLGIRLLLVFEGQYDATVNVCCWQETDITIVSLP